MSVRGEERALGFGLGLCEQVVFFLLRRVQYERERPPGGVDFRDFFFLRSGGSSCEVGTSGVSARDRGGGLREGRSRCWPRRRCWLRGGGRGGRRHLHVDARALHSHGKSALRQHCSTTCILGRQQRRKRPQGAALPGSDGVSQSNGHGPPQAQAPLGAHRHSPWRRDECDEGGRGGHHNGRRLSGGRRSSGRSGDERHEVDLHRSRTRHGNGHALDRKSCRSWRGVSSRGPRSNRTE